MRLIGRLANLLDLDGAKSAKRLSGVHGELAVSLQFVIRERRFGGLGSATHMAACR